MRYFLKSKPVYPKIGETRVKQWFAWFPVCLNREVRWLEWVTVEQVYYGMWDSVGFLDPPSRRKSNAR